MKKQFLAVALSVMATLGMNAQSQEEISALEKSVEKLKTYIEKRPENTGVGELDELTDSSVKVAVNAVAQSELLRNLYYREVGQTKDGVTDVNVKKPTLAELKDLAGVIALQVKEVTSLTTRLSGVSSAALEVAKSSGNPLKVAKALKTVGKSVKYVGEVLPILGKETANQGKAIGEMIKTAVSANRL